MHEIHRFSVTLLLIIVALLPSHVLAQRAFEKGDHVIYEDAARNQTDLGLGFNPVLTAKGDVVFIRGRLLGNGDGPFDCRHKESKNWISVYHPVQRSEKTLFDRALSFGRTGGLLFCIFNHMQLSPDGSILYLVGPFSATASSLAIVRLEQQARVTYVPGVNDVYVIQDGPYRGGLIYQRRLLHYVPEERGEFPYYPFVHARADGRQIQIISEEFFTVGGGTNTPILKAYLRKIGGYIDVNGKRLP